MKRLFTCTALAAFFMAADGLAIVDAVTKVLP
jgi:hypothetical protein